MAEEHASVAEQLESVLAAEFEVVATVADGRTLVRAVETLAIALKARGYTTGQFGRL